MKWMAIAWAMLAASCVTPPTRATLDQPMTVAYVTQHLKDLHGKRVFIRGEIDDCSNCNICDGPAEADACLPLSLEDDPFDPDAQLLELYRFATVVVETRVDAACMLGYDPDVDTSKDAAPRDIVCIPMQALEDAKVVRFESRKPATAGRFGDTRDSPLPPVSDADHSAVRGLLVNLLGYGDDEPVAIFEDRYAGTVGDSSDYFILCMCNEEDCAGKWPATNGQAWARTPANPYYCQSVMRNDASWVIGP